MTTISGPPAPDDGSLASKGQGRWSFRFKLNLTGTLILLTVVIGWIIGYQMTPADGRRAPSAWRVRKRSSPPSAARPAPSNRPKLLIAIIC